MTELEKEDYSTFLRALQFTWKTLPDYRVTEFLNGACHVTASTNNILSDELYFLWEISIARNYIHSKKEAV